MHVCCVQSCKSRQVGLDSIWIYQRTHATARHVARGNVAKSHTYVMKYMPYIVNPDVC